MFLFLFVCLFNDTMVSITDIRCHENRHCRMRSLPKAPTHNQCRESNPRPLDLWSSALPTRPRDPTLYMYIPASFPQTENRLILLLFTQLQKAAVCYWNSTRICVEDEKYCTTSLAAVSHNPKQALTFKHTDKYLTIFIRNRSKSVYKPCFQRYIYFFFITKYLLYAIIIPFKSASHLFSYLL